MRSEMRSENVPREKKITKNTLPPTTYKSKK
jgi:hypothetical protein